MSSSSPRSEQQRGLGKKNPARLWREFAAVLPPLSSFTPAVAVELVQLLLTPLWFACTLPFVIGAGLVQLYLLGGKRKNAELAATMPERVTARLARMSSEASLPAAAPSVSTSTRLAAKEGPRGFQSQFIDSGDSGAGVTLHVVTGGNFAASSKPLLLFVHGFPECWSTWQGQLVFFAKLGFPVAAMDMRGFGLSTAPQNVSAYAARNLVDDVLRVIRKLREQRASAIGGNGGDVVLIAHDWGGVVGWNVAFEAALAAANHGGGAAVEDARSITKLVLCSAPHPAHFIYYATLKDRFQLLRSWYMLFFQLPLLPELWMHASPQRFARALSHSDQELLPAMVADSATCTGMLNYYRAAAREQLPPALGGPTPLRRARKPLPVPVPVLQLWGRHDEALGTGLVTELPLQRWTPHPRSRVALLDATHWLMHDKTKEVNEAILRFVQEE